MDVSSLLNWTNDQVGQIKCHSSRPILHQSTQRRGISASNAIIKPTPVICTTPIYTGLIRTNLELRTLKKSTYKFSWQHETNEGTCPCAAHVADTRDPGVQQSDRSSGADGVGSPRRPGAALRRRAGPRRPGGHAAAPGARYSGRCVPTGRRGSPGMAAPWNLIVVGFMASGASFPSLEVAHVSCARAFVPQRVTACLGATPQALSPASMPGHNTAGSPPPQGSI